MTLIAVWKPITKGQAWKQRLKEKLKRIEHTELVQTLIVKENKRENSLFGTDQDGKNMNNIKLLGYN